MARDYKNISLSDILPDSIVALPEIEKASSAIDPEIKSVSLAIREALIISQIDTLSEKVVDLLAWQYHVDVYEPLNLPIEQKRQQVKKAILLHRHKGTPWAIRQALENIGFRKISIREWTELRTPPHTFAVEISHIDSDQMRNAERCIREYKPERSHLISLIGKLPLWEQAEHVEKVVSQHRHLLVEYYPWPELYYGSPGLTYSGALEYGGPYKYGQGISYGEYPGGVQRYGVFEKSESLSPALGHAIREAVFAEYLYGDVGLCYDSAKNYGADATTTDTAKVVVYNIFREVLLTTSETNSVVPRTVISESTVTNEKRKTDLVHHLTEQSIQIEASAIKIKRLAYYNDTVRYGENYYGQEVLYSEF